MKIVLIVVAVVVVAIIGVEIVGTIAYRRWRKRFDSLSPDEQRKEQARLYKAQQMK